MKINQKSGFTLLEIIIVIIIVGVLASLALPRFFATIEFSRSTEALNNAVTVRNSMERCYFARATYVGCTVTNLDVVDPSTSPGSHFTYTITAATATGYSILSTRNTFEPTTGSTGSLINVAQGPAGVTRTGTGVYIGIR